MSTKRLWGSTAVDVPRDAESNLDRLVAMMRMWWEGLPLSRIAAHAGVSQQWATRLLAGAGCTGKLRRSVELGRPPIGRPADSGKVIAARVALLQPLARRLTPRQRGALAWRAQGLALLDIARRMGTTVQAVNQFEAGAKARIERLALASLKQRPRDLQVPATMAAPMDSESSDIGSVDMENLLTDMRQSHPLRGAPS